VSASRFWKILDQGVTRMLVHRLMAVFPHMKEGSLPPLKSRKATASAANDRAKELHRRSRASRAPPGYVFLILFSNQSPVPLPPHIGPTSFARSFPPDDAVFRAAATY